MSLTTMSIIIGLFAAYAIAMTLVAAYFVAAYKDEKKKNMGKNPNS